MPRGRKKQQEKLVDADLPVEQEKRVEIAVEPVAEYPVAFSTTDTKVTTLLNSQGIHPIACSGSPMVFTYAVDKTAAITYILNEAGLA